MAQHLKHKAGTDLLASQSNDAVLAEDELDLINTAEAISAQPIDWIKNNFPRGTLAGNFLHEIFEHIDFQCSDDWVSEIRRRFKMTIVVFWQDLLSKYNESFLRRGRCRKSALPVSCRVVKRYFANTAFKAFD